MSAPRIRIDLLLVERNLAPSRARAQAMLMAGVVYVGDQRVDKPGTLVRQDAAVRVTEASNPFVSRGGLKLHFALQSFAAAGLSIAGVAAVDVGASTGGFTDCLRTQGARRVYAVDVGYGQLAERLRQDPHVEVRERTNARYMKAGDFSEPIDLVVIDASFIGLGQLMPAIAEVVRPGGALVALVKPQFEAGREAVAKGKGVIRDDTVRQAAIDQALSAVQGHGFQIVAQADSQLPGPRGNVERFVYALRDK